MFRPPRDTAGRPSNRQTRRIADGADAPRIDRAPYGVFMRRARIRNGPLTGRGGSLGRPQPEGPMLDLIYLALGSGGFLAFALAVRLAERL